MPGFRVLVAWLVWSASWTVWGQQELPAFNGNGKIVEVAAASGLVKMVNDAGEEFMIKVQRDAKVTVAGTAAPAYLSPGLAVRFTAVLSEKGQSQDPVAELTIVELSQAVQPGMQIDGIPGAEKAEGPQTYVVVGTLGPHKKGQWRVNTPEKALRIKLEDEATISVDVSNLSVARRDDLIHVEGRQVGPGQVFGDKVEVTLSTPLEPATKKKARGRKSRGSKAEADASPKESRSRTNQRENSKAVDRAIAPD